MTNKHFTFRDLIVCINRLIISSKFHIQRVTFVQVKELRDVNKTSLRITCMC